MSRTPRDMGHPSELVRDKKAVMAENPGHPPRLL